MDGASLLTGRLDLIGTKALLRLLDRPLGPSLERLAGALAARRGAIVSRHEIADEIWGEQSSGGPISADQMIDFYVVLLRRAGLPIVAIRTRGYCVGVDGSGETRRLTDECLLAGR